MVGALGPDEVLVNVKMMLKASGEVLSADAAAELGLEPVGRLDGAVHIGFDHVQVQIDAALVHQFRPAHLKGASRCRDGPIVVQMEPGRKELDR